MGFSFPDVLGQAPVIAVLRHLRPERAVAVGEALVDAGVILMEVPLNGRDALTSLDLLVKGLGIKAWVGAGTVLQPEDVDAAFACGASFLFSPNTDEKAISAACRLKLAFVSGVATPSEAFTAIRLGAAALKLFPGEMFSPKVIKAFRTVLPPDIPLVLSGGVSVDNIRAYREAGVDGFGVASAFFSADMEPEQVGAKARRLISAMQGDTQ